MSTMYWIGVDHHKRNTYVTSLKDDGSVFCRRNLSARPEALEAFFGNHPRPFVAGIEAAYAREYVAHIVEAAGEEIRVGHLCPSANKCLRWAFVETVYHDTRSDARAKVQYDRLKASKGWKTARIAIGRHVARMVYHLLEERRPYRPRCR